MKQITNVLTRIWNEHVFSLKEKVTLNHEIISESVTNFYNLHVNNILNDEHIIVLFRIRTINNVIFTIGQLQKIGKEDKDYLIDYIEGVLYIKSDDYKEEIIKDIIFSFGIRKGIVEPHAKIEHWDTELQYQNYRHYKLPATMNVNRYGTILHFDSSEMIWLVQVTEQSIAKIKVNSREDVLKGAADHEVEIIKNGNVVLTYKDRWIDDNHFERRIKNNIYKFSREGDIDLFTVWKPSRFIRRVKVNKRINKKILTLDIETRLISKNTGEGSNDSIKIHEPYLICYFDGKISQNFFLTDYNNPDEMIQACIKSLLVKKYDNYKIYIHNFANFDGIFLLKNLVTFGQLNVLMNKGKIISIDLKAQLDDQNIEISFRDSYQILLASLFKLGKSFNLPIELQKAIFPYKFVDSHKLDYKGPVPDYEYFDESKVEFGEWIQLVEDKVWSNKYYNPDRSYNRKLSNMFYTYWNLKEEAIKYCILDCKSLYEIMIKFNKLFFDRFKININDHPTLPSLAFRLFRSHYLEKDTIPMIYGDNYNRLKLSYTGGAVDMFIPTNDENELVYAYDVNSLYPFVMAAFPMPVGNIIYFEGDIRKQHPEAFGFFYCKIEVPNNLEHPILQTHVRTKEGIRTVAGVGTYHDMIFSHSYDLAIKLGYKIEILWGYKFDQGYIFEKYVEDLYQMRLDYPKSDPMNYIAKICLNSLYGKFGMRDEFDRIKIVDHLEFDQILEKYSLNNSNVIKDIINLDKHFLLQLKNDDKIIPDEYITKDYNINVAIASAITSYARDYMAQFKNNPKLKLFYSDTDSIYCNLSPDQMDELYPGIISNTGLGKLKLEGIYKKAIFLAPKCYALEDLDGKVTYKVKGLMKSVKISFKDFEALLFKDSKILKSQSKWYKSLSEGTISVLEQSYTLQQTDNKRELIFNSSTPAKVISTRPYLITEQLPDLLNKSNKVFVNNKFILVNN